MLSNEKYKGDALLQKQFTVDYLQKKVKKNEGEVPQYYVEGNHEAIIEPTLFDLVQVELERRSKGNTGRYSGVSIFSTKIKCGDCGNWYGSKVWHSNDKYRRTIYRCNHKFKGEVKCKTPHLVEEEIKTAFIKALNILLENKDDILENLHLVREKLYNIDGLTSERDNLQEELEVVVELTQNCINENVRVAQDQEEYNKRYTDLVQRYDKVKSKLDNVLERIETRKSQYEKIGLFVKAIEDSDEVVTEFDSGMWSTLVDYITVMRDKTIEFTFKDGSRLKV